MTGLDAVTGAYGFTGRAIASQLLASGRRVVTLTNRAPSNAPVADVVPARPLDFGRPGELRASLSGVDTLYATYWVRFQRGAISFERAVAESAVLFLAARDAGVRRIVHVSITGADPTSTLPYFRGKGRVEEILGGIDVPHSIVRPALVFGPGDILVGNIAWLLRRLPVFGIPGDGAYPVQPVHVDDLASLCVREGQRDGTTTVDAVGPEVLSFRELVRIVRSAVASHARLVQVPPRLALAAAGVVGLAVRDVVLTRDEIAGLMAGLLVSGAPPTCPTRFSDWVTREADRLGRSYSSELARHFAGLATVR